MKQYITPEEINQLEDKPRLKLIEWAIGHRYLTLQEPNLSIGQMIEFLDEEQSPSRPLEIFQVESSGEGYDLWQVSTSKNYPEKHELCDALWEAVKEVLEHE